MQNASQQFNLGSVNSRFGQLTFTLVVSNNENAHLEIYAFDPKDMRKSGVLFLFVESSYQTLKDLIAKTDEAVEKLKQSGQIHKMEVSYSEDNSIQINIGKVDSYSRQLSFSVIAHNDGNGYLQLYAMDTSDMRKSGIMLLCNKFDFDKLKRLMTQTDELIKQLLDSNQMKKLSLAFRK